MFGAMFVVICNAPTIDLAMFFSIKMELLLKEHNDVYVY